ncbi:MAG TPA: biopolymer transporter ExbD [Pirellulales bacterium]|jgi:biopolymer transport protein ExbD|nr:biopolymer transporter ExbD [Pirellulales bacterium]
MPLKIQSDEPPVLNLTSMLDVMFLLVIFFMAGSQFTEMERKIALRVPQVSDAQALTAAPQKRVVNVYQDGQIMLERETVSLAELKTRLTAARRQYHDLGVVVRGDAAGPFQRVAEVLNACKQAGIAELAISVRAGKQQR